MFVEVSGLEMSFGALQVLKDISFSMQEGEFVSVVGPSGCGKTTLLRMIAGFLEPMAGTVRIGGKPLQVARERREIGMIFQESALIPSLTALQNVELTQWITRRDGIDPAGTLCRFGLGEFLHYYPHQLSGGMRRRVDIAAGIVHDPFLILMDEPFAALDAFTREDLGTWLSQVLIDKAVIFVTHSIPEAVFLSDRVLALTKDGCMALDLSIEESRPRLAHFRTSEGYTSKINVLREVYA